MKKLMSLLTLGLLLNGNAYAGPEEANVQQVISSYEKALNASNTDGVLKLYSESPIFMPQHVLAQEGREAVKAAYDNVFKAIDLEVVFTTHEVTVLGDTAWARTSSAGKTRIHANNVVVTEGNNELFVFKKENGQWKIHRYLFSTNQAR